MIYLLCVIETIGCKITKNSCKPFINGTTFRVLGAKVVGEQFADGQTQGMYAGEVLADGQIQEMYAGEVLADGQIQEMYTGEGLADGQKQEMYAGEVLADGQT